MVRELEDAGVGVTLVEQPVPARDHLGLAHVRARVDTPVMADESLVDLDDLIAAPLAMMRELRLIARQATALRANGKCWPRYDAGPNR